ncbi:MAG TPA: Hsp70 family protein, partial [Candidatus Angelobacter sp.]|nr:Hsp70 family protein [Candidatus Angelobacter sp.]
EVHVLQGERPLANDNRTLGKFHLTGLPPAPRGVPQIEVTFDIDANGILNVTAKDKATNKEQKIQITSSSGLSKEEVERMAKEAEAHASEDKTKREEIEARNQLDSMVYQVEKTVKEHGDKISGDEKTQVETALADAKKALEGTDAAAMKAAQEKLTAASHKLAEVMYKAQTPPEGAGPQADGAHNGASQNGSSEKQEKKDEGVIDAEYVDVEDKK